MKIILVLLLIIAQIAFAQTIAHTSFEEPGTGGKYTDTGDAATDHPLQNNSGEAPVNYISTGSELGFTSYYYNTENGSGLTDGDYVGVTDYTGAVGAYPDGLQGFQMSDTDGLMVTTLDTVDISAYASVQVSVDYFINEDSYEIEPMDYLHIWLLVDGKDTVDLVNTYGQDIDDMNIEGKWMTAVAQVSGHQKLNVKLAFQSNGSFEAVYFDNIKIVEGGSINIPPVIREVGTSTRVPLAAEDFIDTVQAWDESALTKVELNYSVDNGDVQTLSMTSLGYDSLYVATIPAGVYNETNLVRYWIVAEDDKGGISVSDTSGFFAGTTPILSLKQLDKNNVLLYKGYYARTNGVATVANGVFDPAHLSVYIQDEAYGGINVFRYDAAAREIIPGHQYTVVGQLEQYNGLVQITPDDAQTDITDNGEATMPDAFEINMATLLSGAESFEGLLIKINKADTLFGGDAWPASGTNANLLITDDAGTSRLTLRIDKDTDIPDHAEPTWPQNIVGLFIQFDFDAPFDEGYQILPRSFSDFSDATAINEETRALPIVFKLYSAYPNPFNPSTTLQFDMPAELASDKMELAVYNSLGQKVKVLTRQAVSGRNIVSWQGVNEQGADVASGVYYAVLRSGSRQAVTKLLLIR